MLPLSLHCSPPQLEYLSPFIYDVHGLRRRLCNDGPGAMAGTTTNALAMRRQSQSRTRTHRHGRVPKEDWAMAPGSIRMATGCGSISRLKPSVLTTPAREIETLLENRPSLCPGTWSWSVQTQLVNENFWYKTRQSSTVANGRRPWIFGQFGFSVRIARREMNFGRLT